MNTRRYTAKDVQSAFGRLCAALGQSEGYEQGDWYVDKYNGYQIVEALESGAVGNPFGYERYTAKEFCRMANFALRVIAIDRDSGAASTAYWPKNKEVKR